MNTLINIWPLVIFLICPLNAYILLELWIGVFIGPERSVTFNKKKYWLTLTFVLIAVASLGYAMFLLNKP